MRGFPRVGGRLHLAQPAEYSEDDAIATIAEELEGVAGAALERRAQLGAQQGARAKVARLYGRGRDPEVIGGFLDRQAFDRAQHEDRAISVWERRDRLLRTSRRLKEGIGDRRGKGQLHALEK